MANRSRLASLNALLALVCAARADNSTDVSSDNSTLISFEPEHLKLVYEESVFQVNFTTTFLNASTFTVTSPDEVVATVQVGVDSLQPGVDESGDDVMIGYFNVTSMAMLGYATLNVSLWSEDGELVADAPFEVSVLLNSSSLSNFFSMSLGVLIALMYIVMGATIDLSVVLRIIKKPIGPMLGLFCQYCCMPLFSFGMSQLVFKDPFLQLGMFMAGCSPGGGPSNVWTHLLGGTLDLSITMTFTSTFVALGAIPFWLLILGPVISADSTFVIPYDRIAISLVLLVTPCSFGVFTQYYIKPLSRFLRKILTPLSFFNVCYLAGFGIYANRYLFEIIDTQIFFAALCLPLLGYLAGLALALLLRQPRRDAIAISLETGIQNATVATFLLQLTLPQPASLISVVIPAFTAIITPLPLLCIFIIKTIVVKIRNRRKTALEKEKEPEGETQNTAVETISEKVPSKHPEKSPEERKSEGVDNPAADIEAKY